VVAIEFGRSFARGDILSNMPPTRSLLANAIVLLASCSPFTAEPSDAGLSADVVNGDSDAAVTTNLHPQETFAGPDFGRWVGYHATLLISNGAGYSAGAACQVEYRDPGANVPAEEKALSFSADDNRASLSVLVRERYRVRAWVKKCTAEATAFYVGINARIRQPGGAAKVLKENRPDGVLLVDDKWQLISVDATVDIAGELNVTVEATAPAGKIACFRFDDVSVERLQ
jgi:hypothetical protein